MKKVLYILAELSDLDTDWLMANGTTVKVANGTILIHEGKAIDAVRIVLDGAFRVSIAGGKTELARLSTGEILGEMSFIDSKPPSATVTAIEDSVVLDIPKNKLTAKLKQDPGFAARFYRALVLFLANRLRNTVNRLGYGKEEPSPEILDSADELDSSLLEAVSMAGARFDRMLKKLLGN